MTEKLIISKSLKEAHMKLISLLNQSRDELLSFNISNSNLNNLSTISNKLATLISTSIELNQLFIKVRKRFNLLENQNTNSNELLIDENLKTIIEWEDQLDRRGVELWNQSSRIKRQIDEQFKNQFQLKEIYFKSLNFLHFQNLPNQNQFNKPINFKTHECQKVYSSILLRLIDVTTKTVKALLPSFDLKAATSNIDIACECEEKLAKESQNWKTSHESDQYLRTLINYYAIKADYSWATGNETATMFNLRQALDKSNLLSSPKGFQDSINIISKLYAFSHLMLRSSIGYNKIEESKASKKSMNLQASQWLTFALESIESLGTKSFIPGQILERISYDDLRLKIIKALAFVYFEISKDQKGSEAEVTRQRGDRAFDEALKLKPDQEMWLHKIRRLGQQKEFGPELKSAISAVLKTQPFDKKLLGILHSVSHQISNENYRMDVYASILIACVGRRDPAEQALGGPSIYAIVSFVGANLTKSYKNLNLSDKGVIPSTWNLDQRLDFLQRITDAIMMDSAFITQSLIWSSGSKAYESKDFINAARWFTIGTHSMFHTVYDLTFGKLTRKGALSFMNAGDYDSARKLLSGLSSEAQETASYNFIHFMIETALGNEQTAMESIKRMMSCIDFKPQTMIFAARQADQRGLKEVLNFIFQELLSLISGDSIARSSPIEGLDPIILLRWLIRMDLARIETSSGDDLEYAEKAFEHYSLAQRILEKQRYNDGSEKINAKDATWLWKTAFNTCIGKSTTWPNSLSLRFFDLTSDLINLTRKLPVTMQESREMIHHELHCRFAHLAGTVNNTLGSESKDNDQDKYHERFLNLIELISKVKTLCEEIEIISIETNSNQNLLIIESCLCVWEFEGFSKIQDWNRIAEFLSSLEEMAGVKGHITTSVLETIADVTVHDANFPIDVVTQVLRKVLSIYEKIGKVNVELHSRWLRILIEIEISTGQDDNAIKDCNSALILMQQNLETYPSDEADWILGKSWDRSIDLYNLRSVVHSINWCEISMKWMKLVTGGRVYEEMMNRHYRELLKMSQDLRTSDQFLL
ncbi:uncharacterized protein MELLADRAFT_109837 [Melampsora larici-populina 98AG31]|uniref:Protein ZIP4 homolog n=1 Tax=Melampsora larici-populina (strain 98AG31 / pathotype 3-4-7) TaxID=747676 RepID=F4RXS9_MELLP|nr:uncharacterized protein MELLADRAFT_109837 [Melampsora larici-populina 98AG31]EGG02845.1 hypothetical protein MELLADRAFT_109837 [Melampsora larici-populina 98AG31]